MKVGPLVTTLYIYLNIYMSPCLAVKMTKKMTVYRSGNKIIFNTEILATPLQKKSVLLDTLTLVDTNPTQDAEDLGEER